MRSNVNPETGERYGVIATDSLDPDLVETLFYGSQATNVTEEEFYEEAEAELRRMYQDLLVEARAAAAETGADREVGFDSEAFEEAWFEKHEHRYDEEDFVERGLESDGPCHNIEEPTITGTYEGVTYQISWLGGASLLWSLSGPTGNASSLCSPCLPNAGDLSIFVLDSEPEFIPGEGFPCYCVPRDWLAKEAI